MQWIGSGPRHDIGVSRGRGEKVQKCKAAYGLCKGAKVEDIFGSQISALRSQLRVVRYRCGYGVKFRSGTCTRT